MTELRWENQMCVFLFDVHRHTELAGKQQSLLAVRRVVTLARKFSSYCLGKRSLLLASPTFL